MDKLDSQSSNNNLSAKTTGSGTIATLPLPSKRAQDAAIDKAIDKKPQPDALQKDLELLARLREQIKQLPDIDTAKIVELHERIARGEYRINSQTVADKLSDFESDF